MKKILLVLGLISISQFCFAQNSSDKADTAKGAEQVNSDSKSWEDWFLSVEGYLEEISAVSDQIRKISDDAAQKMSSLDQKAKLAVIDEVIQQASELKKTCANMSPPPEFKRYHEKVMYSLDLYLELMKLIKADPDADQTEMLKRMETNGVDIMKEGKRVFVEHGMPADFISQLDEEMSQDRQASDQTEE
jgi:hypothetical protein